LNLNVSPTNHIAGFTYKWQLNLIQYGKVTTMSGTRNITCLVGAPTRHVISMPFPALPVGGRRGVTTCWFGGSQLPSEPWLWVGRTMISLARELFLCGLGDIRNQLL
jgi:hypothetical protein